MTFTAWDSEPSSPSQPPGGVVAPPGCDASAEPAGQSEAHGPTPEKSPSADAPQSHGKAPAASLISISNKKPAGPAKSGDLTRFFEVVHRQGPASTALPTAADIESEDAPATASEAAPSAEIPAAASEPELAPYEATLLPPPAESPALAEPADRPEIAIEPNFPLMLAPPAPTAEDEIAFVSTEPDLAPVEDTAVVAMPRVPEASTAHAPLISSRSIEPLTVSLAPAEEAPAAPEALEPFREEPEPATSPAIIVADSVPLAIDPPATPEIVPPVAAEAPSAPPAVEPPRVAIPVAPAVPTFKELADYWRSLRHGAEHPTADAIDRDLVTERWPGALLITYTPVSHDPHSELRPGRVTRLGSACAETQNVSDAGSQSTEWMLEAAHTALINDEPVEEQQRLSTLTGVGGFRMVALPLGAPKGLPNAVLCTLLPCSGAPRFGKRRIWL